MKRKWMFSVVLVVALTVILGVGTVLAGMVTTTGTPPRTATSDVSVTLSATVNEKIGINMDAAIITWTIDPTTTGWLAGTGSVNIALFYNGAATWHLKADNTGTNFSGGLGLTVSNVDTSATGNNPFSNKALSGGGVSADLVSATGPINGWKTSNHTYRYNVQGTEVAGTDSATIKYTMSSTP